MSLRGRYFSERDLRFINSVNAELNRDIIETLVTCFKIVTDVTNSNIYGESMPSEGKCFYNGIELSCIIKRQDQILMTKDLVLIEIKQLYLN
jgi:hypothetical protein